MRETNETALVVKNDSFFERLKEFLKMFFGINGKYALKNEEELKYQNEQKNENKESNIENNVTNNNLNNLEEQNYEEKLKEILLELQDAYENGIIVEDELTIDQKEDLKKLYLIQINILKNSIDEDEKKIFELKEQIENK